MTKDKFLRSLEKKLSMLSEEERKDTIDEYRDIIEEKIKHGKTESEAVKEFGSIDELAGEILNAYKINPNYKKSEAGDKAKEIVDGAEELIKKGAKKISEVTDDVVDSFKKSDIGGMSDNTSEFLIKLILLILILSFIRIPIHIITGIGSGVLEFGIWPFSNRLGDILRIVIELFCYGICIFLIVKLVIDYSNKSKVSSTNENTNSNEKSKQNEKDNIKETSKVVHKKNDTIETIAFVFLQLFIIFILLIPLIFVAFLFLIAIIICIYLLSLRIDIYGFFITSLGCFGFVCSLINLVYRGMISSKKVHLYPFIIFIVMIVVGGVMSFAYIFDFEYHNYLPENNYKTKTDIYTEDIDSRTIIDSDNASISIDNNLEDNKIRLEVTYYPHFSKISKEEEIEDGLRYLGFDTIDVNDDFSFKGKYSKQIIKDIRKRNLYNYSLFTKETVKIYVNENTRDLVEIN